MQETALLLFDLCEFAPLAATSDNGFCKIEFFQDNLIHKSQFGKAAVSGSGVVQVSELERPCAAGDGRDGVSWQRWQSRRVVPRCVGFHSTTCGAWEKVELFTFISQTLQEAQHRLSKYGA